MSIQENIWISYADMEDYSNLQQSRAEDYDIKIARPVRYKMSSMDWNISEFCDFLETWGILIITFLGTVITVSLFYRNKIKTPLAELKQSSKLISENDLDFMVLYENEDEMGQLCMEFEKMRKQLGDNNKQMWKMMEQEKALRAAISHDIRAPLTIIKGYQEMLLEMASENSVEKEKLLEMIQAEIQQTGRMESFINTMHQLSKLEERNMEVRNIELKEFVHQLEENIKLINRKNDVQCCFLLSTTVESAQFDSDIVIEVLENLIGNALRYTRNIINVKFDVKDCDLIVTVSDDGAGFTEEQHILTKPYFHGNSQDNLTHFGLGLYICGIYCEKHGGKLLLENSKEGGAVAIAYFHIENEKEQSV